jgi:Zn-dependent metalloprotease
LKQRFSEYLDFLDENYLWKNMPDKVKLKNINLYNTLIEINWEKKLLKQLEKFYKVIRVLNSNWELKHFVQGEFNKDKIINWNYLIFAEFWEIDEDWDIIVEKNYIIEKKQFLWQFPEKVRWIIDEILPKPKPVAL